MNDIQGTSREMGGTVEHRLEPGASYVISFPGYVTAEAAKVIQAQLREQEDRLGVRFLVVSGGTKVEKVGGPDAPAIRTDDDRVLKVTPGEFDAVKRAIQRVKARAGGDQMTDGQCLFVVCETYGLGVAAVPPEEVREAKPRFLTHDGMKKQ